ncbi:MAG: heavy metal-binding domain-containing protein [Adhaeribacter sp.]
MKNLCVALAFLLCLAACKEKPAQQEQQTEATTPAAPAAASQQLAYVCPMACEGSASDKPGKCPVCAMDLMKNPEFQPAADSAAPQPAH